MKDIPATKPNNQPPFMGGFFIFPARFQGMPEYRPASGDAL
jgi:hypothetical protein